MTSVGSVCISAGIQNRSISQIRELIGGRFIAFRSGTICFCWKRISEIGIQRKMSSVEISSLAYDGKAVEVKDKIMADSKLATIKDDVSLQQ